MRIAREIVSIKTNDGVSLTGFFKLSILSPMPSIVLLFLFDPRSNLLNRLSRSESSGNASSSSPATSVSKDLRRFSSAVHTSFVEILADVNERIIPSCQNLVLHLRQLPESLPPRLHSVGLPLTAPHRQSNLEGSLRSLL